MKKLLTISLFTLLLTSCMSIHADATEAKSESGINWQKMPESWIDGPVLTIAVPDKSYKFPSYIHCKDFKFRKTYNSTERLVTDDECAIINLFIEYNESGFGVYRTYKK